MRKKPAPSLTKLESEVMSVIWDMQPENACVRDVVDLLNNTRQKQRRKELAYNTVQTVVILLKEKKALRQVKTRAVGRAHYFQPCVSRDQASRHILADLSKRMFGGEIKPLIHQLIDEAEMSPDELMELKKWVANKLKDVRDGG